MVGHQLSVLLLYDGTSTLWSHNDLIPGEIIHDTQSHRYILHRPQEYAYMDKYIVHVSIFTIDHRETYTWLNFCILKLSAFIFATWSTIYIVGIACERYINIATQVTGEKIVT